jgi:tyrosine-protein kinase
MEASLELSGYFGIARRWWAVLVLSVALAAVGGYAVASELPKVYEGEVRVLVGPLNTDFDTQRAAGQLANTYAQLATSRRVTDAVIQRLGVPMSSQDLVDAINAIPNDVTRLVTIRVQASDPTTAANLANAIADEIGTLAAETQRPEGQTQVVDPAVPPKTPIAPQVLLIVMLAAFAGFLAAISLIVLIEYARDAVHSEEDLRRLSGQPILGTLRTRLDRRRDIATAILGSGAAEAYRTLTSRIEHSVSTRKVRSIMVTGLQPNAQAAVVANGIALAFAERGVRTALVDGNADDRAATMLGVPFDPGVEQLGDGSRVRVTRVDAVVDKGRRSRRSGLSLAVVPGGGQELVKAEQLKRILDTVSAEAQITVVASPRIDRSSEALLWAGVTDAVVLVVPIPGARRKDLRVAIDALRVAGRRFVGTIVTDAPSSRGYRFGAPATSAPPPSDFIGADATERHEPGLGRAR